MEMLESLMWGWENLPPSRGSPGLSFLERWSDPVKNLGKLTMFNSLNIFSFHRVAWNLDFLSKLSQCSLSSLCRVRESELPWVHVPLRTTTHVAEHGLTGGTGMNLGDFSSIKGRSMIPYQNHQIALIVPRPVKFPIHSYVVLTLLTMVTDQTKAAK